MSYHKTEKARRQQKGWEI